MADVFTLDHWEPDAKASLDMGRSVSAERLAHLARPSA